MSSVDYLAIVDAFSVFLVKNVPIFNSMDMREEARRFITFLDIIYDAKVRTLMYNTIKSLWFRKVW